MAESRLLKLGTIFTRVNGLIRGGRMKFEDRPLWYDVYEAFPPKLPPVYDRAPVMKEIDDIMYPEDIVRAEFFKRYTSPGVMNLVSSAGQTLAQRFVDTYLEVAKDPNVPRDQLFERTASRMQAQGTVLQSIAQLKEKSARTTQAASSAAISSRKEISESEEKISDFVPQNPLR